MAATRGDAWSALATVPTAPAGKATYYEGTKGLYFALASTGIQQYLQTAPQEFSPGYNTGDVIVSLPRPDGSFQRFHVWEIALMEPGLAAQFPGIKTFRGQGIDEPAAALAMDYTPLGFHAQVLSPCDSYYLEPYYHLDQSVYISYYKQNLQKSDVWTCFGGVEDHLEDATKTPHRDSSPTLLTSGGTTLRTYRTAVAATGEYTAFFGGTVANGQAAIVTSVNRVSGVYEKDFAVRLTLIANNSSLVYTDSASDPYTNANGSTMLGQNQSNIDSVIGSANYDLGHVFSTGGGGIAGLGVVTVTGNKARGVTGRGSPVGDAFDIDYVAHEMGHQFGGNHTFNGVNGSAAGNRASSAAYEPGSASTIMGYAGICGVDDLQPNSDAYFHAKSLDEVINFIATHPGNSNTATGNSIPTANAGADRTIPANTPFALTGTGTDGNGDALTYCFEEFDLGAAQGFPLTDNGSSPIQRSFNPTTNPVRTLPRLSNLLANTFATGEILPTTSRTLNYRLTVRDNRANGGGIQTDDVKLTVVNTGAAFAVTSPNTAVSWQGNSVQTVTWNVAGTTANGINAATVNILLSTDGGNSFPVTLAAGVANDGSENITLPNTPTGSARIKVQPVGNIFFDVSNANFTITAGSAFQVTGATPTAGSTVTAPLTQVDLTFNGNLNPASVATGDLLTSQGSVIDAQVIGGNTIRFTLVGLTQEGTVTLTLPNNAVTDTGAVGNGQFATTYTLDLGTGAFPTPLVSTGPLGSLAYNGTVAGTIGSAGDTDSFTVDLDAGQVLSAIGSPDAGLRPTVTVTGPAATNVSNTASAAGSTALVNSITIGTAGTYTIAITGAASTTGAYTLRLDLGSAVESEGNGGSANDSLATAQSLATGLTVQGGIARLSVRGKSDNSSSASESEPNNSTATANSMINGFAAVTPQLYQMGLSGNIAGGSDASDYFNIGQLQTGDILTISESGSWSGRGTNTDPLLELWRGGSTTTFVQQDDDGGPNISGTGGDSLIHRFTITTTDTYYVRADSFNTITGTYQLGIWLENTSTAPTTGGGVVAESANPNGTLATAENASTSWRRVQYQSAVSGTITAGDSDFYAYQFNAGDLFTFFADSTSGLAARVNLRNSAGTVIAFEDGTSVAPALDSPLYGYRFTSGGTYYVEVLAQSGTGTYTLNANLSATIAPPPLLPGDDLYAVTLGAGQPAVFALDAQAAGTLNFALLDSGGAVVANGVAGAANFDSAIRFTSAPGGTFFARVNGTANVPYTMSAVFNGEFDTEANDSFAIAQALNGTRALGAISGSDDWYQFPVTAGQQVTLTTATPGDAAGEFVNGIDPVIELYDPAGVLVGTNDNGAGDGHNATLSKVTSATGNYRARILPAGGTSGEYTLQLTTTANPVAKISAVQINDGSAQRSMVTSLQVTFDSAVTFAGAPEAAFQLKRNSDSAAVTLSSNVVGPAVSLTFTGGAVDNASLADGRYTLTVLAGQINSGNFDGDGNGTPGDDYVLVGDPAIAPKLYRLFGDGDGDNDVDAGDFGALRTAFGGTGPSIYDFDGDNDVDTSDFGQFRARFGASV